MKQYRVIKYFTDLQDRDYEYNVGDIFPHEGKDVSDARIAELSSDKNAQGVPLIEAVEETPKEGEKPKTSAKAKARRKTK